jgi:hypothetical protein
MASCLAGEFIGDAFPAYNARSTATQPADRTWLSNCGGCFVVRQRRFGYNRAPLASQEDMSAVQFHPANLIRRECLRKASHAVRVAAVAAFVCGAALAHADE